MHFAGILPADAPDPRLKMAETLKDMPIPVVEFVEQRSLEITDFGISSAFGPGGYSAMTVSVSATLWRNPDDKSDPVNLAELDEATRRAVEEVPPWPRPGWLIERVERLRYPILWEAVQTTWNREESEFTTLEYLLVQHTNYILMNQFREQLQLDQQEWDSPALTSERVVRQGVSVVIACNLWVGTDRWQLEGRTAPEPRRRSCPAHRTASHGGHERSGRAQIFIRPSGFDDQFANTSTDVSRLAHFMESSGLRGDQG